MKLPTVKLVHKSTGRKRIVNATDYQRDIGAWKDWKILTVSRGDAPDKEVERASRESDENKRRLAKPKEQRKRGDRQRAADRKKIRRNIVTDGEQPNEHPQSQAKETEAEAEVGPEFRSKALGELQRLGQEYDAASPVNSDWKAYQWYDAAPPVDPDWKAYQWFKRKAYVKKITGTAPANMAEAEQLMADR